jgi:hypothetical protein
MGIFLPLEMDALIIAPEPPEPYDGRMWINDSTSDSYVYDGTRSKWLSASDSVLEYSYAGNAGNRFLKVGDISHSEYGYSFHDTFTITAIDAGASTADVQYDIITSVGGVDTVRFSFSTVDFTYENTTLTIDVNVDHVIKIYCNRTGSSASNPICLLRKHWRYDV